MFWSLQKSIGKHLFICISVLPGKIGLQVWKKKQAPHITHNFFDWNSQMKLTGPNKCKCVGIERAEFMTSLFCLFGTPASWGSLSSSLKEVYSCVCALCAQWLSASTVASEEQGHISCTLLACLKREPVVIESWNISLWRTPIRTKESNSLLFAGLHKYKPHDLSPGAPWTQAVFVLSPLLLAFLGQLDGWSCHKRKLS